MCVDVVMLLYAKYVYRDRSTVAALYAYRKTMWRSLSEAILRVYLEG